MAIPTRLATHAEAVYIARALNLRIETVWQIIQGLPFSSFNELELAVHAAFLPQTHRSIQQPQA